MNKIKNNEFQVTFVVTFRLNKNVRKYKKNFEHNDIN